MEIIRAALLSRLYVVGYSNEHASVVLTDDEEKARRFKDGEARDFIDQYGDRTLALSRNEAVIEKVRW